MDIRTVETPLRLILTWHRPILELIQRKRPRTTRFLGSNPGLLIISYLERELSSMNMATDTFPHDF